ncbi:carboxymuconolactone decarboxylase family protein [Microbacterium paludicola]|uniref:carboxymuconolactone decarboxylase family protein n=1 Tax=Microbacterium paludicola TaxID=300019 RepID=UPI0031CF4678
MPHVNISKTHPEAYKAMLALSQAVHAASAGAELEPRLIELVKIRASQLNGCAFCLRMHTRDAIKAGETADRLAVLAAWWESQYFTDAERAALQLAEDVTLQSDSGRLPDRGIDPAAFLDEAQISAIVWLVVEINAWNRIAVASHYPVAP